MNAMTNSVFLLCLQSSLLYPKYCEPVERGESELTFCMKFDLCPLNSGTASRGETRKLWRHIEPYFRGVMSKIHLREISRSV